MAAARASISAKLALVLSWSAAVWCSPAQLRAGDPIQFYSTTNSVQFPKPRPQDSAGRKSFDFFHPDSSSSPMPEDGSVPPATRNAARSRRLQELIDQQKNWIFRTPDSWSKEPTPEEMFNVREESLSSVSRNSSKT